MPPPTPTQGVSAQFLLEGAVYALEQAGRLLHDAHLLYKNQRYGSAIVMALFSREEIGRYQLIRQLRKRMLETGGAVTTEDIDRACDDHVRKQSLGQFGLAMKVSHGEQLWDILQTRMQNHPQSQEHQEATKRLDAIVKRLSRTLPHDRHELRQKTLYVEPADSGTAWNRPKEQTKEAAFEQIEGGCNAYGGAIDRFTRGDIYQSEDPAFYNDLKAWTDCPLMPNQLGRIVSFANFFPDLIRSTGMTHYRDTMSSPPTLESYTFFRTLWYTSPRSTVHNCWKSRW
jgi:AbiV family abortive infection protein